MLFILDRWLKKDSLYDRTPLRLTHLARLFIHFCLGEVYTHGSIVLPLEMITPFPLKVYFHYFISFWLSFDQWLRSDLPKDESSLINELPITILLNLHQCNLFQLKYSADPTVSQGDYSTSISEPGHIILLFLSYIARYGSLLQSSIPFSHSVMLSSRFHQSISHSTMVLPIHLPSFIVLPSGNLFLMYGWIVFPDSLDRLSF